MAADLASITSIISSVMTLFIALQTKGIYRFFNKEKAYSKDSAVSLDEQGFFKKKLIKRIIKSGEIVQIDKKYYLDQRRCDQLKKARIKRIKIIVPIVVIIILMIIAINFL